MPEGKKLPQVRLVALGEKTSEGQTVTVDVLVSIYSHARPQDMDFFVVPDRKNIEDTAKTGRQWFAVENEDGQIVGGIAAQLESRKTELSLGELAWKVGVPSWKGWIGRGFIIPKHRGKGYLSSAIMQIEEAAKKHGVRKIYGLIARGNTRSIRMFKKAGLTEKKLRSVAMTPANIATFGVTPRRFANWFKYFSKRLPKTRRK